MASLPSPASAPADSRAHTGASALRVARRQHGVITRRDLLEAGYSASTISRLVHRGILQRMHQGIFHAGPRPTWKSRCMAAVLAAGPGAVLSHTSAARVWGLLPEGPEPRIHVTIPRIGRLPGQASAFTGRGSNRWTRRLRFPRFNGHSIIEVNEEVSDGTGAKEVPGGVSAEDGGVGPSRPESGGAGEGVRAVTEHDLEVGNAVGYR